MHTLLQILVFQALFLAVYDLFLKKETFFNLNRIYLLLTPILGCILPFISINFLQQNIPQEFIFQLPTVIIGSNNPETVFNGTIWFSILWLMGMLFSGLFFIWKFYKIIKLNFSGTIINSQNFKLVILPKTDTAFSFFNTIFLGENISKENKANIIAHEKIHIKQKHSLDLLFFEMLRIIFWFNPMVYLFQNRMATLHEFIADAKVAAEKDKKQYYQNLLSEVFQTEKISFINTFFNQSLIKKRIIMLQKSKSKKTAQLKYLVLLPAIFGMLFYTACSDNPKAEETQTVQQSDSEVIPKADGSTETDVPFGTIEKVPVFPGCTGADNETLKKCFSENISGFVGKNFNTKLANDLNLSGIQRIIVRFKIDKTGKIVDVQARAPKPELEAEAIRVIEKLPQMEAGEQEGEKVAVLYSLPIVFEVK